MNFLFVDKIFELIPGEKSLALKNITAADHYLIPDWQERPMIMSCILGEALGQLCSWNVIKTSDFKLRLIGGVVGEVKIYDNAYVGDTVILENYIDVLDLENQVVNFRGIAKVNDKLILSVENGLGPLLPIEEFGDPIIVKKEFQNLYRPNKLPAFDQAETITTDITYHLQQVAFDKILVWKPDEMVIAQKNLSLTAPYFADHFPHKPVMPLSLLLECKMQLGYQFLVKMLNLPNSSKLQISSVKRIKMSGFVQPGDILTAYITLKERNSRSVMLNFRSEVEQKRVCVAEAEYRIS